VTIDELLGALWRNYIAATPEAARIHALLTERGELLRNDHIALRTIGAPGLGLDALARPFEALGWRRHKHHQLSPQLRACTWRHADPALPGVFICELALDALSPAAQAELSALLVQLPAGFAERADLAWAGRPWQLSYAAYQVLARESDYAAWVAAFGFGVNHFAVDVGSLSTFPDLAALNAFLIEHGFALADRPPPAAGSPSEDLEQSATQIDSVAVAFSDATVPIPCCYYEFARRKPTGSATSL
jgi:hypothetical protein